MSPQDKALELFNKIRYMDGENKNCTTCDCVIKPIVNYMIDEILSEYEVLQIETNFCYKQYLYWQEVKAEIEKL